MGVMRMNVMHTGVMRMLRRFLSDTSGVNAIEFAMAAPILITLYFGTVEISDRLMADRKATTLAATAADLTAQETEIDDDEMDDILDATASVLLPFNPANATIRISSVIADDDGNTTVAWSDGRNTAARTAGSAITVPDDLVPANGSIIVTETTFSHTSATGFVIQGARTVADTFYLRPRRSIQVERVD